jgi:hypothetical protein
MNFSTEDQFQAWAVKWFSETFPDERGMLFSIPNGGERRDGWIMKATGVIAGVADLCLIYDWEKCVWIEMKLPHGVQSKAQKDWEWKVKRRGHEYIIIRTAEHFKQFIWSKMNIGR